MRIGKNPAKDNIYKTYYNHRIIVPVYIGDDRYFHESFSVFKTSFQSLLDSIPKTSAISIFINGENNELINYLERIYRTNNNFDILIKSKINIGKINAILSCLNGISEDFVTISDSDVWFQKGWTSASAEIFHQFPLTGIVGLVPFTPISRRFTKSTLGYGFLKNKLRFKKLNKEIDDMKKFDDSLGNTNSVLSNKDFEEAPVLLNKENNFYAFVGAGHFCFTAKREVLVKNLPFSFSKNLIGNGSENLFFDQPNDKNGFLRLTTNKNYAYHIGNSLKGFESNISNKAPIDIIDFPKTNSKKAKTNNISYLIGSMFLKFNFHDIFCKFYRI